MTTEARARWAATLPRDEAEALLYDWRVWARDAQLAPTGDWWTWWLILAGRGFGKTRSGAEFILERVRAGAKRIALVGPTAADVRDTMVETGPGSILQNCAPWDRPVYEPSKRRVTWPQYGAVATTFSADEPERFRGPGFDTAWCDELGAWKYQQETWDMLEMGFREGNPQGVITTTPRPTPVVRALVADAKGKEPTVVVTRGSTFDNASNLAPKFLRKLLTKYTGTRLGLQELEAQLLDDTPGALWTVDLLAENRVRSAPPLKRVGVAVDPQAADPNRAAASEDDAETGIVAGGIDERGDGYLLRDASDHLSPGEWGERAVLLYDELGADFVVAEVNNGGAMVPFVVRTAAEKLHREGKRPSPHVNVRVVSASRGKHTRAEPIAALDEQHRIHHVGYFGELEPQMTTWVPGQKSPDRMDARVWLFTALMLTEGAPASDDDFAPLPVAPRASLARPADDEDDGDDGWGARRS